MELSLQLGQTKFRNHQVRNDGRGAAWNLASTHRTVWEPLRLHIQRANYLCSPQDKIVRHCLAHISGSTFAPFHLVRSFFLFLRFPAHSLTHSLSLSFASPTHLSVCRSSDLSLCRLSAPALHHPPWYSGLINCVYTAVNSYRCLAPANWSSSRVLLLHTPATTTTTHATGIPRFNSRGMISSSQPSLSCVPFSPAAVFLSLARSFSL